MKSKIREAIKCAMSLTLKFIDKMLLNVLLAAYLK